MKFGAHVLDRTYKKLQGGNRFDNPVCHSLNLKMKMVGMMFKPFARWNILSSRLKGSVKDVIIGPEIL